MPILSLTSIRDTTLWKRLDTGFSGPDADLSRKIASSLEDVCQEAYDRMKAFPSLHPEYTLHDEAHLLRVTELMSRILPERVAERLNPVEILLLILAAHFHDQGMVLDPAELESVRRDPKFLLFRDNWAIAHPNLREIEQQLRDRTLSEQERARCREIEQELHAALLTDWVRQTHGDRSARIMRNTYGADKRLEVVGTNVAELAARLCASHVRPARDLTSVNGFRHDEVVGTYRVNMPYLGLILRLADILDFDRDRTPDSLYRTIHFKSPVSLREWEKHRSVEGWVIQPALVQFTMRCEHPEYQRAAYHYMDWIDRELADAHAICRSFPAPVADYQLDLPLSVDRSRVEPKDGAYIYSDLEFSLSRDEIIKLLMTDKLYGEPRLAIRELLQNALDALRHRRAVIRRDLGADWTQGRVEMTHELDPHGYEVVRCTDNGIGMDRSIVERFLTRAGRSYYRSPEFEQERESFRAAGGDFDPCAQFGIGFMSCFMLGDRITVHTRRDHGPNRGLGEPVVVEINGLGGIVVLRPGRNDQPTGTTVEIMGRRKPSLLDESQDSVKLIRTLDAYALATEFPITGRCTIPELKSEIYIPIEITIRPTILEKYQVKYITTLEQTFSEIDSDLRGSIRTSFLVDDNGEPSIKNSEYEWRNLAYGPGLWLQSQNGEIMKMIDEKTEQTTCIDGIRVAGSLGRNRVIDHGELFVINPLSCSKQTNFILDVRGELKPPLTPARIPLGSELTRFRRISRWSRLQAVIDECSGRLLSKLAARLVNPMDPEKFWSLALIQGLDPGYMPAGALWSQIAIPVGDGEGFYEWQKLSELSLLEPLLVPIMEGKDWIDLRVRNGRLVGICPPLGWLLNSEGNRVTSSIWTAIQMSTVAFTDDGPRLVPRPPDQPHLSPASFALRLVSHRSSIQVLPYSGEIRDLFTVHLPFENVNRTHPLARIALEARWLEEKTNLQSFAESAISTLSDRELSFEEPSYSQKLLGHMHRNLDWKAIDHELHPPYKIYTGGRTVEVTAQMLEEWADAPVEPK